MTQEQEQNSQAPDNLANSFMTEHASGMIFLNAWVSKLFLQSAITSVCLAGGIALVILIIATHNIIMAALAFSSILLVVLSVLGVMVILGWKIGVIEAMCMSLIVGFSVDYVVLSLNYIHKITPLFHIKTLHNILTPVLKHDNPNSPVR